MSTAACRSSGNGSCCGRSSGAGICVIAPLEQIEEVGDETSNAMNTSRPALAPSFVPPENVRNALVPRVRYQPSEMPQSEADSESQCDEREQYDKSHKIPAAVLDP